MLFNSYVFIFLYLPVTVLLFFTIARISHKLAAGWLTLASLFFYGWWNPAYVALLIVSVCFNYAMGIQIARFDMHRQKVPRQWMFVCAITANLLLLGYYKYANFFLSSANSLAGTHLSLGEIILPLGISFFTFTQIAFLVDTYRGEVKEYDPVHYGLFVTYFPHLIAGPVLHHRQMMPQFAMPETYRPSSRSIAIGLTFFTIGLAKKVLLADSFGEYATPVFDAARVGLQPKLIVAWTGALAYTFQLYFDFSGYSDMAVGLSRLFGVQLPINFNSPYKAPNIIEFWRRWHMTLSQFLRDYLYFPLGGNRHGKVRRYINLLVTMLLGGLWHGASWTFVAWGGLHGLYLIINHLWHAFRKRLGIDVHESSVAGHVAGVLLTFPAVVVGWVFFRANSFEAAASILRGMAGMNGISLPGSFAGFLGWLAAIPSISITFGGAFAELIELWELGSARCFMYLGMGMLIIWFLPNTQDFIQRSAAQMSGIKKLADLSWKPTRVQGALFGILLVITLVNFTKVSTFLYYQF